MFFYGPDDDNSEGRPRSTYLITALAGIVVMLLLGLLLFARSAGSAGMLIVMIVIGLVVLAVVATLGSLLYQMRGGDTLTKAKRKNVDMFALIDRLVDDLDADEAAYLRQRLDAIERRETAESLEALLDDHDDQESRRRS